MCHDLARGRLDFDGSNSAQIRFFRRRRHARGGERHRRLQKGVVVHRFVKRHIGVFFDWLGPNIALVMIVINDADRSIGRVGFFFKPEAFTKKKRSEKCFRMLWVRNRPSGQI